ncbi:MAG: radical SAM protein [Acidobacteria bacterium]|nr:radical SAM protein [Acidobacteriota bacterium]MBI3262910.1 radical SAM protein [Acidobacteriota bacterium]
MIKRVRGRLTHELHTLPVLVLEAHSACNCRCVMCDIWKANASRRELTRGDLEPHLESIRTLGVRRIVLTGGEPLLHSNLWTLCDLLEAQDVRITLLTTGILLARSAEPIARHVDEVIVSIDGSRPVHDAIRRVAGGFDRIAEGVRAVRDLSRSIALGARSVVQKTNYRDLPNTVAACRALGLDWVSFLAADLTTTAFNRPVPWNEDRRRNVALSSTDLPHFAAAIAETERLHGDDMEAGFVAGGSASLWRLHQYYAAHLGLAEFPRVRCNAPWVSAVLEADGSVRPCFFHRAYGTARQTDLRTVLNSDAARAFRQQLDIRHDETCRRCVCSLQLGLRSNGRI